MIKRYPILKKLVPFVFLFFVLSRFKQSVTKIQLLSLLVFIVFSFKGNAQCTITGTTVNSGTINPCTTLSGCSIVYIGDGVNPTTLVMYQNLDLTCLGAIQFIIRNNASLDFSNGNFDLKLAVNSSIIVENGGNVSAGSNCSNSDLIWIGGDKVASCTGAGPGVISFPNLVTNGGFNTINATSTIVCNPGTSTITAVKYPTPTSETTYKLYDLATGGTPIQTIIISSSPYEANFTTPNLTSTTNYFIEATTSGATTPRRQVIVTVVATPTAPTTNNESICSGSSATLVASGAVAAQIYKWYSLETGGMLLKTGTDNIDNNYVTPAIIATTDYWVSIVNSNGCESVRIKATAFVNVNNRWNGSVSSDWNTAGNWCIGVPNATNTLDVIIPTGLTNYPIIYDGAVSGYVENIVFEPGTTLNVVNNSLRVTNNLTLNGKIDLEGESQLLQDTGSAFDAASTGTMEIDQQGTGNSFRYNYWSSPVNSMGTKFTIDEVLRDGNGGTLANKNITYGAAYAFADGAVSPQIKLSTYWMYVLRNSGAGYSAWYRVGNTGEILVGEGYTMKGSNTGAPEQNYTFVGKPNNGTIELDVNAGNEYLVGNPYPSAIDADQFLSDNATSITGAIYFWEHYGGDTHNLVGYQAGYATYSLSGGVQASSHPNVSSVGFSVKGDPKQDIPVGQAFFVVGDADGGQIQFNNGQRVFVKESDGNSIFMKNSKTSAKKENTRGADFRPKFRIGFDAPKINHRQLLLTIDERATQDVDWGFDAEIYEIFADDMYWMLNNKKYVIQGTNNVGLNSEVPLGIQLSKAGVVTVKIDALENVDDNTSIYLKDKLTGESFKMKDNKPVQLNLVAGKYADRFVLTFKTQKLAVEDVNTEILIPAPAQPMIEGIHVNMNKARGELQIKNNSTEEIVSVALRNSLGQTVKTWNSNFNIRTISLPISTATGIYLVQINTKTGKTVKKISVE
jgi:hypothetical protein